MTELLKTETYARILENDHGIDSDDLVSLGALVRDETRAMFDDYDLESTDEAEEFVLRSVLHEVLRAYDDPDNDRTIHGLLDEMREGGQPARSNVQFAAAKGHGSVERPYLLNQLEAAIFEEKYSHE